MDLTAALTSWFATHRRALPWRHEGTSAWGVLVSEVMSQQTPVNRVAERYLAWMARWPTPTALAAASQEEVIKMWDRLGYPRRALALHRCAMIITRDFAGNLPADEHTLVQLPGIGPYTAAAVRAFGFRRRAIMLDTNIRRVIARLHGEAGVPAHVRKYEWERANDLIPKADDDAVTVCEALMELGALVCRARNPRCEHCPVSTTCQWFLAGKPGVIPTRARQAYHGTHRQARGNILAALRAHTTVPTEVLLTTASTDRLLSRKALASLCAEGFITETNGSYRLARTRDVGAETGAG